MSYMPGAASLAATHRGKVKNIHLSTLRDNQMTQDPKSCILNFEKETEAYDATNKKETQCKRYCVAVTILLLMGMHVHIPYLHPI